MENNNKNKQSGNIQYMPIGMCIGIGVGMAIGAAMDSISTGMCIGLCIGMGIGAVIDTKNRKAKAEESQSDDNNKKE